MELTHNVINDLWPLYASGEASPDTVRLVEEHLAKYPELAERLETGAAAVPRPDLQMETLSRVKRRLDGDHWLFKLACVFTALSLARLVMDTTFTASPHRFVVTAVLAVLAWIGFGWTLHRARRRFLLVKLR